MKKLRLKALSLGAKEILNREQLQSIYGGFDGSGSGGSGGGGIGITCWCGFVYGDITFTCYTEHSYDFECVETANATCFGTGWGCSV